MESIRSAKGAGWGWWGWVESRWRGSSRLTEFLLLTLPAGCELRGLVILAEGHPADQDNAWNLVGVQQIFVECVYARRAGE